MFKALAAHLDSGKSAPHLCVRQGRPRHRGDSPAEPEAIIYANMDEDGFAHYEGNAYFRSVRDLAAQEGAQVLPSAPSAGADICQLDDPEGAHVPAGSGHREVRP